VATKRKRAPAKKKKVAASRVRIRDLDARKGKIAGGGQFGYSGGGFSGVMKKPS
jgi:hypothetical protein